MEATCQICAFIIKTEDSVVRNVSVQDIITGSIKLPFISRTAWQKTQQECSDLRQVHAHLVQGTRPSKKLTTIKDVKRYLSLTTIAGDGLLVVKSQSPLTTMFERILVPRQVLDGLLTALHIKLDHPSRHQLKLVVNRYFYALDMDKAIERVSISCPTHHNFRIASHPKGNLTPCRRADTRLIIKLDTERTTEYHITPALPDATSPLRETRSGRPRRQRRRPQYLEDYVTDF